MPQMLLKVQFQIILDIIMNNEPECYWGKLNICMLPSWMAGIGAPLSHSVFVRNLAHFDRSSPRTRRSTQGRKGKLRRAATLAASGLERGSNHIYTLVAMM
jgi:hypothetical protein